MTCGDIPVTTFLKNGGITTIAKNGGVSTMCWAAFELSFVENTRVDSAGNTRVTSAGNIRVTKEAA